jgi:hypothetical protein
VAAAVPLLNPPDAIVDPHAHAHHVLELVADNKKLAANAEHLATVELLAMAQTAQLLHTEVLLLLEDPHLNSRQWHGTMDLRRSSSLITKVLFTVFDLFYIRKVCCSLLLSP